MKFPEEGKIVQVTWLDTISYAQWLTPEEATTKHCPIATSIGAIFSVNKNELKLYHSICDGSTDITIIPWSVVINIQELEYASSKKKAVSGKGCHKTDPGRKKEDRCPAKKEISPNVR